MVKIWKWIFIVILLTIVGLGVWAYVNGLTLGSLLQDAVSTPGPLRVALEGRLGNLTREGILNETNKHRAEHNVIPLKGNAVLDRAAAKKLEDMFAKQYFDHVSPTGAGPADVVEGVGYKYIRVGENLALGNFPDDATLVQAWMDSPGHRANILSDNFTELGVAARRGQFEGKETWLAVQSFALPASACPTPGGSIRESYDQKRTTADSLATQLEKDRAAIDALENEIEKLVAQANTLAQRGNEKIAQGNAKMEEGNQVYQETGSKEQAQPHWDEGERLQAEGEALRQQAKALYDQAAAKNDELNQRKQTFNANVAKWETLRGEVRSLADQLNRLIRSFNRCLEG
jgi:hypothetical protein